MKILENVDYETFQILGCNLAKDKNGFFIEKHRATKDEVKKHIDFFDINLEINLQ